MDRKVLNEFLSEIIASEDQVLREDEPVTVDTLRELWSAKVRAPHGALPPQSPHTGSICAMQGVNQSGASSAAPEEDLLTGATAAEGARPPERNQRSLTASMTA